MLRDPFAGSQVLKLPRKSCQAAGGVSRGAGSGALRREQLMIYVGAILMVVSTLGILGLLAFRAGGKL